VTAIGRSTPNAANWKPPARRRRPEHLRSSGRQSGPSRIRRFNQPRHSHAAVDRANAPSVGMARNDEFAARVGRPVDAAIDAEVSRFIQESFAPVYEDGGEGWIDELPRFARPRTTTPFWTRSAGRPIRRLRWYRIVLRFAAFYGADQSLRDVVKVVRTDGSASRFAERVLVVGRPRRRGRRDGRGSRCTSGLYNICDDDPDSREWARCRREPSAPPPKPLPHLIATLGGRTAELLRSQRLSNGKLKSATGWQPKWPSARRPPAAIKQLA
jgi:hypothetical protein